MANHYITVSISESSIFSFQVRPPSRTSKKTWCFNLVIEYLLFSSRCLLWRCRSLHRSFNLGIEYLLFSSTRFTRFTRFVVEFQSRNRVSSLFKRHRCARGESGGACFNLVIEYLLFSSRGLECNGTQQSRQFQSRNRVSSLFKPLTYTEPQSFAGVSISESSIFSFQV